MTEFWVSSGHHFLQRTSGGGLKVTDEYWLAYLARPELVPPPEACEAERGLHERLLKNPQAPVSSAMISAIQDEDARENWQLIIAYRDRLSRFPTLEAAYLSLVKDGFGSIPPLFVSQMVHLILRNALDGVEDPFILRAAECFFRTQKAAMHDGRLLLADAELIEEIEAEKKRQMHALSLAAMMGGSAIGSLDVLTDETVQDYWSRSDAFSMVLDLGGNPRSRDALGRAIEVWLSHLLGLTFQVEPIERIEDQDWRWFVGLDSEATAIGNQLWKEGQVDPTEAARLIAFFRLTERDEPCFEPAMRGKPVYLMLAMGEDGLVRMKPQNLLSSLPIPAKRRS